MLSPVYGPVTMVGGVGEPDSTGVMMYTGPTELPTWLVTKTLPPALMYVGDVISPRLMPMLQTSPLFLRNRPSVNSMP